MKIEGVRALCLPPMLGVRLRRGSREVCAIQHTNKRRVGEGYAQPSLTRRVSVELCRAPRAFAKRSNGSPSTNGYFELVAGQTSNGSPSTNGVSGWALTKRSNGLTVNK